MRILAGPLVLLLATGCLPERDNVLDPAHAPAPVLVIRDATAPGGGCLDDVAAAEAFDVAVASRGACLLLDASATTDPQGTPADALLFRFHVVDDPITPVVVGSALSLNAPSRLALPPERVRLLQTVADDVTVHFQVTAIDPTGARGTAVRSIRLHNARPVIRANPPRTLPLGGMPWDTGPAVEVVLPFRAEASDPDGDLVTVRWVDESDAEIGAGTDIAYAVDASERVRRAFRAIANDGLTDSIPASSVVQVGEPFLFASPADPENGIPGVLGYDRTARTLSDVPHLFARAIHLYDDGGVRRLVTVHQRQGFPPDVILSRWPDGGILDQVTLDFGLAPSGVDPWFVGGSFLDENGRLWILTRTDFADPSVRLVAIVDVLGNDTLADVLGPAYPSVAGDPFNFDLPATIVPELDLAEDGLGHLASADRFGRNLRLYDRSGGALTLLDTLVTDSASGMTGVARRPFTNELWVAEGQPLLDTDVPASVGFRRVLFSGATADVESFPVDASDVYGIAWADEDRFWTALGERGYCLVDAPSVEAGFPIDLAILVCADSQGGASRVIADPVSGSSFWTNLTRTRVVSVQDRGTASVSEVSGRAELVDPAGQLWWLRSAGGGNDVMAVGKNPTADGVAARLATDTGDVAPDGTGGLWVGAFQPRSLRRVAEDGALSDFITELDVDGTVLAMPLPLGVAADGRGHVWVQSLRDLAIEILLVDVDASRAPSSPHRAPATLVTTFSAGSIGADPVIFHGTPTHAWFRHDTLGIVSIDATSGAVTAALAESVTAPSMYSAVLPRSGGLCVARPDNNDVLDLYFLQAPGAAVLATSWAGTWSFAGVATSGSTGPLGEELCWIGLQDQNTFDFHLRAYDSSGAVVESYDELGASGLVYSIAAPANDEVWLLRYDNLTGLALPFRVDFPASAGIPGLPPPEIEGLFWIPPL